jgi:outer membrane lipoprotein-sorting protein
LNALLSLLCSLTLGAAPAAAPPAADDQAWALLDEVRQHLVTDGATVADFTQDFVPTGFNSGDRESGRLSLALPSCLRWDYEIPYAKSFLLCGQVLYFWNQGEGSGRRAKVDPQNEPGLDLLLLSVGELRQRYRATAKSLADGAAEIVLEPAAGGGRTGATGAIANATLRLDAGRRRVVGLTWDDVEGNRTRFEFSGFRAPGPSSVFTPPSDVTWEDDTGD